MRYELNDKLIRIKNHQVGDELSMRFMVFKWDGEKTCKVSKTSFRDRESAELFMVGLQASPLVQDYYLGLFVGDSLIDVIGDVPESLSRRLRGCIFNFDKN